MRGTLARSRVWGRKGEGKREEGRGKREKEKRRGGERRGGGEEEEGSRRGAGGEHAPVRNQRHKQAFGFREYQSHGEPESDALVRVEAPGRRGVDLEGAWRGRRQRRGETRRERSGEREGAQRPREAQISSTKGASTSCWKSCAMFGCHRSCRSESPQSALREGHVVPKRGFPAGQEYGRTAHTLKESESNIVSSTAGHFISPAVSVRKHAARRSWSL
eukprot:2112975-Rhodomonas_salina.1